MSGADDGRDGFEDDLSVALRRTGEGFTADGRTLVDSGVQGGRRRLRRRRAGAVTGSVAALAVVGLGSSYAAGAFDTATADARGGVAARPSGAATAAPEQGKTKGTRGDGTQLSGDEVLGILEGLLPEGKVSAREGRGTADMPSARLVHDDGHGKSAIGVSVGAVDPGGATAEEQLTCPDKVFVPYDSCTSETLSDGSRLLLLRGYEYPDKRVDTKRWHAFLMTREGYTVDASEWNSEEEKGKPVSRPEPPLSTGQLKALVTSAKWRPVMRAIGEAAPEVTPQPPAQGTDRTSALKKLKSLLPSRVRVTGEGGEDGGYAYVVVDDGKGASFVQINVQPGMNDVRDDLFGSGAETMPDGTLVSTKKGSGDDKGGAGIVMWTADTMRPDGFRVVVSAVNSGSQRADATRGEPALTMAELKKIALSEKWLAKK
ncbi:hypothetical protein OKJ48_39335 [Streptomyces kunmingensis]|uniref:LigA protein n=1 Tax=Streptomyces kunmingensis TaxID=68225 RepID=A0ABU6CND0_9ACTN|nr:hypothetical protein [Streptomyces kunmingensis]MEB3966239.1 hypothetical protein [Streptomyces kunmingensis]